jgi:AAA family ATP:ADP antiporter
MSAATPTPIVTGAKSRLDRTLSLFTDVHAGEGMTAVLMLLNICLLLVCYSVIKTVREPLILLGGGAEVRSYAAAGQALLLIGFVPLYGWIASRVNRTTLITGMTLFFVVCIELFAAAVAAGVPYVGVAFFVWVGIFNVSLVAQFWSFASDLYRRDAGDRLFPIIMVGMTAGAPIGSFTAARLFRLGLTPQLILQVSAVLLTLSALLYAVVLRREGAAAPGTRTAPLAASGGFRLVLSNQYLRLVGLLIVLLNIVNTTGEYMVARLLTVHANALAAADATFNKQAYIGEFSGDYQFWVNVVAFVLQAFVTSRLVKFQGLRGALLVLPLIALGGYSLIAAGVSFSVVRWLKTAENATDYSIMNTGRQLLWLPTSREEKYKAKQAIDTFCVRAGDVLSAGVVFLGAGVLHLDVRSFALANTILTLAWLGVALLIVRRPGPAPRLVPMRPMAGAAAAAALLLLATAASAQDTRQEELAGLRAEKATNLHAYEPSSLERRIERVEGMLLSRHASYPFIGSVFEGGGIAVGPGYRCRIGESGSVDVHAAWSVRNVGAAAGRVVLPAMADGRLWVEGHAERLHAPEAPL